MLRVWDVNNGKLIHTLEASRPAPVNGRRYQNPGIQAIAWSPDGTRLANGGHDQMVRVWDLVNGSELLTLKGHGGSVNSVAFSPENVNIFIFL